MRQATLSRTAQRPLIRSAVILGLLLIHPLPARAVCVGDCNDDSRVKIDELVKSVNIALDIAAIADCLAIETNADGRATVNELILAVNNALFGCPVAPTPTPTPPPTAIMNRAPQVNAGADVLAPIDRPPTLTGSASDDGLPNPPHALTLAWSKVDGPGTVAFGSPSAATTTATASAVGSYRLRLTANDGALSASDEVMLHVDIAAANVAPTLDPVANQTITPGTALSLRLVGHDGNPFDALTYSRLAGPQGSTVSPEGVFSFTPTATQLGTHTVGVQVRDGGALSAQTSFDVTVVQGNRPPVLGTLADDYARPGALYTKTLTASDPDTGDTLRFALLSGPEGMSLSGAQLAWMPAAGQLGAFTVKVEVADRAGSRDRGEFLVTVPLPGTILARDDAYEVVVNHTLSVPAPGVLGNDEDLAGSTLSASKLTDPDKGMLTAFNSDGSFTYVAPVSVETPPLLDVTTKYQLYDYGVLYSLFPPLVADLDGEGKPEIIFWIVDTVYAVHGDTGELLFSAAALPEPYTGCAMYGRGNGDHFAVADIDDDGVIEIVMSAQCAADNPTYIYVAGNASRVLAIAYDAAAPSKFKVKWLSQPLAPQVPSRPEDGGDGHLYVPFGTQAAFASYTIARLRPTEKPTILFGKTYSGFGGEFSYCGKVLPGKTDPRCRFVFALDGATGAVKTPYYSTPDDPAIAYSYDYTPYNGAFPPPIVADVDNDGQLDILFEGTLWDIDGTIKRQFDGTAATGPATADSAVVDLDGDAEMEILTLDNAEYRRPAYLKAWKPDGRLLWSLVLPATTVVTPMSIADIDRSGHPSILLGIYDTLFAVDHTGRIKWLRKFPLTAGFWPIVNGAGMKFPVYDLNGDGIPEIVVQPNNQTILFLRGNTGDTQTSWSYPGQAETGTQNVQAPVIADIDGSGHASLIWYHQVAFDGTTFLQVLKGDTVPWRPAPAHFNQGAYWETNFNVDGSVPTTYVRHTTEPKTNLFGQQPPAPYVTEPRLRTQTSFSYTATNGGLDSTPATVTIGILPENHPPVVTSMPPSAIPAGDYRSNPFTYQITAFDPDLGDVVAYQLTYQGCGFEGTVTVSPAGLFSVTDFNANESLCPFQVRLSDGHGGVTDHVFSIFLTTQTRTVPNVIGLQLPAARAALITADLVVGRETTVPDAAPAGQVLAQNPAGGTSVLRGSAVDLTVSAGPAPEDRDDDGDGFTERQHDCDDTDPLHNPGVVELPGNGIDENCDGRDSLVSQIVVEPPSALVVQGVTVAFKATAVYTDGTSSDATAMGSWLSAATGVATVDGTGAARALTPGTTAITVTFGGAVGHASLTVADRAAGDQDSPTAVITTPANGGTVTGLTQVTGTAADANFLRYQLGIARAGEADFTTIGEGTAAVVDGVLGTVDPTLLINDVYTLRLTVWDANENQATAEICVQVAGERKIGIFTLSFTDLTVDVSGIPIEVTRTYDSRDKRQGDFGVGWSLQVDTIRLSANRVLGTSWQVIKPGLAFGLQPSDNHFVSVTLPNGDVEQFDLLIAPTVSPLVPLRTVQASFVPRPGTLGTLEPLDNTNLLIADPQPGEVELLDDATLDIYNPQTFRYTTANGREIVINAQAGVQSVTDRSGNTLTFAQGGITHSSGVGVTFERDARGRVTRITDPSGAARLYAYDANGDLRSYTDPLGKVTRYTYTRNHGLLDIIDPLGIRGVRNEYDEDGRLVSATDADGRTIRFTHDDALHREVITNRLGHVRVVEYDAEGNITARIDPLGQRTEFTYDSRGNELTRKDPLGRVQTNAYDAANNLLSTTDVDGNLVTRTYNARNQLLTSTNAAGTTTRAYDSDGNLTSLTDPDGRVTTHTYNAAGQVLTTTEPGGHVTRYGYDAAGRRTSLRDAAGTLHTFTNDANGKRISESAERTLAGGATQVVTSHLAYDAGGNATRATDALGHEIAFDFDGGRRATSSTDANGHTSTYEYDARGNLTRTTFPDDSAEVSVYDAEGRRTSFTDRDGNLTSFVYGALGHLLRTVNPDGTSRERTYDAVGRLKTDSDERGNTTTHTYASNQETVTDALGKVTVHEFDALGRMTKTTDALGRLTSFTYDSRSNLTATIFPDGSTYTIHYDPSGTGKTSETDQAGRTTTYDYDALGRLTRLTDGAGGVTTYRYDEVGNLVSQTDAKGRVTALEYDALGRLTKRTRPLGQFETFTRDATGNVLSHTDFNGDTTTFTYDVNNRLVRKTFPGGAEVTYAYTPAGLRTAAGGATYAYDSRGRLTSETKESGDVISYAYDAAGNRTTVTTPEGTTSYGYDALNRLATVVDASGTTMYGYDAVGNRKSEAYPNGVNATYTYDSRNRLTNLSNTGPGGVISSYTYTLGAIGNRTRVVEAGSATSGRTVDYGYDALCRLTSETIEEPGTANDRVISYTFDEVGNRLTKSEMQGGGSQTTDTTYAYDDNDRLTQESQLLTMASLPRNTVGPRIALASVVLSPLIGAVLVVPLSRRQRRLGRRARRRHALRGTLVVVLVTASVFAPGVAHAVALDALSAPRAVAQGTTSTVFTYSYDANGNTLTRSDGVKTNTYDYDFENRLSAADIQLGSAGPVNYSYDADGIRTSKTAAGVTSTYLADKNRVFAQVLVEDTAGAVTTYTYGDDRISMTRTVVGTRFYQRDGQHSTRQLTSSTGIVTDSYAYDGFGVLLASAGTTPNEFLYTGEQLDGNVGFYYLRARYYAQGLGRFISVDPFQGSIFDPASLHRYLYVHADPVNRIDPSGLLEALPSLLVTGAIILMVAAPFAAAGTYLKTLQGPEPGKAVAEAGKAGFALFALGAVLAFVGYVLSVASLAGGGSAAGGSSGGFGAGAGAGGAGTAGGAATTGPTVIQVGTGTGEITTDAYGAYATSDVAAEALYKAWQGLLYLLVLGAASVTGQDATPGSSTSEVRASQEALRDDFPTASAQLDPLRTDQRRQRAALGGLRFLAAQAQDPELRDAATFSARVITLPPA